MGRKGSGRSTVEHYLEQMGFTRSISYTTREPRENNGVMEENGKEYRFVTEEKFMKLVDNGKIIEYERYGDNLYGTPVPYGSTRYVSTVCINGFRALKKMYGEQVLGVYLQCSEETSLKRSSKKTRLEQDEELFKQMEAEADIVIDSDRDTSNTLADILKALRDRNL
jgi:guanylate kinase